MLTNIEVEKCDETKISKRDVIFSDAETEQPIINLDVKLSYKNLENVLTMKTDNIGKITIELCEKEAASNATIYASGEVDNQYIYEHKSIQYEVLNAETESVFKLQKKSSQ